MLDMYDEAISAAEELTGEETDCITAAAFAMMATARGLLPPMATRFVEPLSAAAELKHAREASNVDVIGSGGGAAKPSMARGATFRDPKRKEGGVMTRSATFGQRAARRAAVGITRRPRATHAHAHIEAAAEASKRPHDPPTALRPAPPLSPCPFSLHVQAGRASARPAAHRCSRRNRRRRRSSRRRPSPSRASASAARRRAASRGRTAPAGPTLRRRRSSSSCCARRCRPTSSSAASTPSSSRASCRR